MLVAEIHISPAVVIGIVGKLFRPVLDAIALPVIVLDLRRPGGNLVRQLGIQIFLEILPVLAASAVTEYIDTVDTHCFVLQALQLTRTLNGGHDCDDRGHADNDAQHGQDRADLIVQDGLERHAYGLEPVHSSSPPLPASSEMMRPS